MADHSKPTVTSLYADFVTELDGRFDDLALGLDPATTSPTNVPTNAIRWNSANKQWDKWNGTSWVDLSSDFAIDLAAGAVISGSTSTAALRITQTGAGDALLVEDASNPDSSPFVIDASGNVSIGATSTSVNFQVIGSTGVHTRQAATQDGVALIGRAGGTSSYEISITPTTLTADRILTLPDATTTVVGTDVTQTLTNKRFTTRVSSAASASSVTPDISAYDVYAFTALAAGLTINAPTGTPVDGDKLLFRFLDNGTARALTWNATYTAIGVTLPTTTVINKTTYVGCIYNANNTRWDVVAVTTQA